MTVTILSALVSLGIGLAFALAIYARRRTLRGGGAAAGSLTAAYPAAGESVNGIRPAELEEFPPVRARSTAQSARAMGPRLSSLRRNGFTRAGRGYPARTARQAIATSADQFSRHHAGGPGCNSD